MTAPAWVCRSGHEPIDLWVTGGYLCCAICDGTPSDLTVAALDTAAQQSQLVPIPRPVRRSLHSRLVDAARADIGHHLTLRDHAAMATVCVAAIGFVWAVVAFTVWALS